MAPTEAYFVARTVRALERLAFGPVSAPELADYLHVHPRTARRLMQRLRDEHYVTQPPGARRYQLTPRLLAVAAQAQRSSDLGRWSVADATTAAPDAATIADALRRGGEQLEPDPAPHAGGPASGLRVSRETP